MEPGLIRICRYLSSPRGDVSFALSLLLGYIGPQANSSGFLLIREARFVILEPCLHVPRYH